MANNRRFQVDGPVLWWLNSLISLRLHWSAYWSDNWNMAMGTQMKYVIGSCRIRHLCFAVDTTSLEEGLLRCLVILILALPHIQTPAQVSPRV